MSERIWKRFGAGGALSLIGLGLMLLAAPFSAQAAPQPIGPATAPQIDRADQEPVPNEVCLACHSNQSLTKKLYDGTNLSLYVNPDDHGNSVHGEAGLACVDCHIDFDSRHNENPVQFPGFQASTRRDASLKLYTLCQQCHADQYEKAGDSVHGRALQNGNVNAAICIDCHTAHTVRRLNDPATGQLLPDSRLWIPETCAQCHSTIYAQYRDSVHGAALTQENNLDVPTCIDCHGVHNIPDPTTDEFRLKSPNLCGKCHADASIMNKYGISTQVFDTYVADFHGTTVTLFQKESPDAPTNKPVCFDCHGVHDIVRTDDPQKGLQVRQNILTKCQVCHPGASENFSEAWLSHYIPSQDKYPLVYFVNLFYQIFIPTVLGGMAILVILDVTTKLRKRARRSTPPPPETVTANLPSIDRDKVGFDTPPADRPSTPDDTSDAGKESNHD